MKKLWGKLKHRWNRIQIWFFMRGIKKDLDRIDKVLQNDQLSRLD